VRRAPRPAVRLQRLRATDLMRPRIEMLRMELAPMASAHVVLRGRSNRVTIDLALSGRPYTQSRRLKTQVILKPSARRKLDHLYSLPKRRLVFCSEPALYEGLL
jgi:hypothetical protein